jgi:hypothetical protein
MRDAHRSFRWHQARSKLGDHERFGYSDSHVPAIVLELSVHAALRRNSAYFIRTTITVGA